VRLVPGVDDRALQGGLQPHLDLEEVRPLADLELVLVAVLGALLAMAIGALLVGAAFLIRSATA